MKPYFAKYIPVDEEIRDGNTIINKEGEIFTCRWEPCELTTKKVKLFLCSRDIQPNDLVLLSARVDPIPKKLHPDDFERGKHLGCFKIIEEISPEAKWVKEGDEFDEDEIYYVGGFQGLIPDNYAEVNSLIEIKGPCGHFH